MRPVLTSMLLCSLAVGCGGTPQSQANPEPPPGAIKSGAPLEGAVATEDAEPLVSVSGMDLYMHDYAPTGEQARKPRLWVHADSGRLETDGAWTLDTARMVVYQEEEEDLVIDALTGRFDEQKGTAQLEGGVRLQAGTMQVEAEAFEWVNAMNLARSLSPVRLEDPKSRLNAQGLSLDPGTGTVTLTGVTGELSLQ